MLTKTTVPGESEAHADGNEVSLGSYLREARIAQGLDLSAIAEETRITIKNLVALEEDNRAALPANVFIRGFVKLYTAHLKLDPQEALRLYDNQWGGNSSFHTDRPSPANASSPIFTWSGIIILLLIALFFGIRFFYPDFHNGFGEQNGSDSLPTSTQNGPITPRP